VRTFIGCVRRLTQFKNKRVFSARQNCTSEMVVSQKFSSKTVPQMWFTDVCRMCLLQLHNLDGSAFHTFGPATEKDLSVKHRRILWIMKSPWAAEWSVYVSVYTHVINKW